MKQNKFEVGDPVVKKIGYKFPGEVRAVVVTRAGRTRYVVEATGEGYDGMLHIFNSEQLTKVGEHEESQNDSGYEEALQDRLRRIAKFSFDP